MRYAFIYGIFLASSCFSVLASDADYESEWHEEINVAITKTLIKHNIEQCGQYKWKASLKYPDSEFLVYCTRDGNNWVAYQVWTRINEVEGPFAPGQDYP